MDRRSDIREFLVSRRARITPEQAGLAAFGSNRRVPGLRREEVAMLAGVSVDYYTRMERGGLGGASEGVLEALARALQLDETERDHLFGLARISGGESRRRVPRGPGVRPGVIRLLDAMAGAPAFVWNNRLDVLAANRLGLALYSELYGQAGPHRGPGRLPNHARFIFLGGERAQAFYVDWARVADDTVAVLRLSAGKDPYDKALSELVGELSTRSVEFSTRWAAHNVMQHRAGRKRFRHPVVGELDLDFESMELSADPGLSLTAYTAPPGSPTAERIALLASWSATADREESSTPAPSFDPGR